MTTLLALIPHPDDESYSFGGTIALAADAGWRCVVVCASSGEKGKRHDGGPLAQAGAARERELAASCAVLGAEPPLFWNLPDGGLPRVRDGEQRVAHELDSVRPDLALSLGADGAYGHPDHIAVHRWVAVALASMDASARPVGLNAAFPRGLFLRQYDRCVGMMGDPPDPPADAIGSDAWPLEVDVTSVSLRKLEAVAAHRTQLPGGDPEMLFPPGNIAATLAREGFATARAGDEARAAELLASIRPTQPRNTPLEAGVNLGRTSAGLIRASGTASLEELRTVGAVAAYLRVRHAYPDRVTLNWLYAIHGAIVGRPFPQLAAETKAWLRAEVAGL